MPSEPKLPTNWPRYLRYLISSVYHSSVSAEALNNIRGTPSSKTSSSSAETLRRPKTAIRVITTDSHPAKGQYGLFAAQKIAPKTHIVDYIGEIHCDDRPESDYDLSLCRLPDGTSVGIDASTMGNEARFVNDYRGVSSKPNAVFVNERGPSGELKMSIWTSNAEIRKGEEILVSYGKSWWQSRVEDSPYVPNY
ncbi:hypothetical protein D9613_001658 [Agrocybe pediades]|uniref:SET domain-containing protein n=1 Tax=Agrocybe pediades TaxID=84607 RepID=A0A8H4VUN3_9AGAR|nr:hypothetical protein D9613_001658 [Agrocybe pediades]